MPAQLEGMQQLMAQIEQMGRTIEGSVTEKALKAGAEVVKSGIQATAPVRTGNLKANIIISEVEEGKIHIGPDQQGKAFYGHFLEFGTTKMSAQPFMRPGYENKKGPAEQEMADVIKSELNI